MSTYKLVRHFQEHKKQTIDTGLTLEEVQKHCSDPETSWKTCTSAVGSKRTRDRGEWFDGYYKE